MHNHVLSFLHIPKTGGTTLLAHFMKHWGQEQILLWGPWARLQSFFSNVPQIEERSPQELNNIRLVLGHGVNQDVFTAVDSPVKLGVVLRHPVTCYRSRYNHHYQRMVERGATLNSTDFVNSTYGVMNSVASTLISSFPDFVDPQATTEYAVAASILQKFDYVLTTEDLDEQARLIMPHWSLPATLERKRVAVDKVTFDREDSWIAANNSVDRELHTTASKACKVGSSSYNAFGFDEAGKEAAVQKILARDQGVYSQAALQSGYEQLAEMLCQELRAPAAIHRFECGFQKCVKDPNLLKRIIAEQWDRQLYALKPKQLELAEASLAREKRRCRARPSLKWKSFFYVSNN